MPIEEKPSRNEDEYFVKLDAELIRQMRSRLDRDRAARERSSHYMKCPRCGADLQEREYNHVKVDRCPECHGAWFDAGELDFLEHTSPAGLREFFHILFWAK